MQYEEPAPLRHEEVLRILREGSGEEIERALIAVALLDENFDFGLSVVLQCAMSDQPSVRGTAILCLGHLARIHGRIPEDPVVDLVKAALVDENEYVRGHAESAADDIALFVPSVGRRLRQ
jgi:hypothetical protein